MWLTRVKYAPKHTLTNGSFGYNINAFALRWGKFTFFGAKITFS